MAALLKGRDGVRMVGGFVLGRRDVVEGAVQAPVVVPIDPFQGGRLEVVQATMPVTGRVGAVMPSRRRATGTRAEVAPETTSATSRTHSARGPRRRRQTGSMRTLVT